MQQYILRRLLGTAPVLLVAVTIIFLVLRLIPGDPVNLMLQGQPASDAVRQNIRRNLGLDRPFIVQYIRFISHALQGDLGTSFRTSQPVIEVIGSQFLATLQLAAGGMAFGASLGLGLGIVAGLHPNGTVDTIATFLALLGISLPGYWLGMLLIFVFGLKLGWVPILGTGLRALILPSIVFGTFAVGDIARLVRSSMLEVMRNDYIRTAHAKGVTRGHLVRRHALPNALIPAVTVMGLQLGLFITGGVLTETVFARQGIGALLVASVLEKDYPVVQAVILITTTGYILANFAVDILYTLLDPRIRYT